MFDGIAMLRPARFASALRALCLSFPSATEQIQWGYDLVFKVSGKMFCVMPAPYLARAKWALERCDAIGDRELVPRITRAYEIVRDKLPAKIRATLSQPQKKTRQRRR